MVTCRLFGSMGIQGSVKYGSILGCRGGSRCPAFSRHSEELCTGGEIAGQFKSDLPSEGWCHPLRRSRIMVTRRLFGSEARAKKSWCGRRDLNPHGPCGPTDFHAVYGFRRPDAALGSARARFAVWTIPSPSPRKIRGLGAARLVSTPYRLESPSGLGSGLPLNSDFPEFEQFCHRRFPGEHSSSLKSAASASSAVPALESSLASHRTVLQIAWSKTCVIGQPSELPVDIAESGTCGKRSSGAIGQAAQEGTGGSYVRWVGLPSAGAQVRPRPRFARISALSHLSTPRRRPRGFRTRTKPPIYGEQIGWGVDFQKQFHSVTGAASMYHPLRNDSAPPGR
jgi:hypothetical protein